MKFELKNEQIRASINLKGAELNSIRFNESEYLWQADKNVWPRHAPVLFPIVGKLKNDAYFFNGEQYQMGQHGFARDKDFAFKYKTNSEIELELKHDSETLKLFPFQFKLTVRYKLQANGIDCLYRITNTSSVETLLFSIGSHPGFKIPLQEDERYEDYVLEFFDGNTYKTVQLENGLLTGKTIDLIVQNGRVPLNTTLFENDAMVFDGRQINQIELKSLKSGKGIRLDCDGWPFFGIWSKPGCSQFICLEPWYGIADSLHSSGNLEEKKGIMRLLPDEFFNCRYSMSFF